MKKTVNRLSVLLLMVLGVLPQIYLLAETMGCGTDPLLWLWILGAALCLWLSACFRRGILLGMPAGGALLYAAFRVFASEPLKELDDLIDKFSGAYYTQYLYNGRDYTYLNALEDHSFLLLLIAFLLLAYLSSALTARSGRRFMSFLGTVPLFAACIAVTGLPSYTPVVATLLFWMLILVSGNYREEGSSGKTVFLFALPLLLMLCAVLWTCHPEDYRFDEEDIAISRRFDKIGEWIRDHFTQESEPVPYYFSETVIADPELLPPDHDPLFWESAAGELDLTQNSSPEMLEKVFFRVRSEQSGALYLRGVSYGDYLGTGWGSAPEAPLSSLGFAARAIEGTGERHRLTLEMLSSLRYALLPYFSAESSETDAFLPGSDGTSQLPYFTGYDLFDSLPEETEDELLYRRYAHEVYTRLPEDTKSVMQSLAAEVGLDPSSPAIVEEVAAFIRSSGVYDIETEPYPSTDYAVWFLTQAHRGYCIHFATAATAMYRALGIPARITEGFLVPAVSDRFVEGRGENAHAWVEIYRDGVGWIPVEVTGQSGLNPIPASEENSEEAEAPVEQPEETSESAPVSETPMVTPAPTLPVGIVKPQENAPVVPERNSALPWRTIWTVLGSLLLLTLPWLWRLLIRTVWQRRLHAQETNRAAVALWKRAQQLSSFGRDVPAEIQNCAEKAVFSAFGITEEEFSACLALLDREIDACYAQLSLPKKLRFLFLYGLR